MHWLKICQNMTLSIYYQEFSGDFLKLGKQKGVYPYEHMDSFEKFSEDKLHGRCEFFSSLKDKYISEKDN